MFERKIRGIAGLVAGIGVLSSLGMAGCAGRKTDEVPLSAAGVSAGKLDEAPSLSELGMDTRRRTNPSSQQVFDLVRKVEKLCKAGNIKEAQAFLDQYHAENGIIGLQLGTGRDTAIDDCIITFCRGSDGKPLDQCMITSLAGEKVLLRIDAPISEPHTRAAPSAGYAVVNHQFYTLEGELAGYVLLYGHFELDERARRKVVFVVDSMGTGSKADLLGAISLCGIDHDGLPQGSAKPTK